MIKGWVKKEAAIKQFKSTMCKSWIETKYNKWAPCIISLPLEKEGLGKVKIRFSGKNMPLSGQKWEVLVDIDNVMFQHKILKCSIPLKHYDNFMAIINNL